MYTDEQLEMMKKQWEAMGMDPEVMLAQIKLSQEMTNQMQGMMQNAMENSPLMENMANMQASMQTAGLTLDDLFAESEPIVKEDTELNEAEQKAMLCAGNLSFYADQPMNDLSTGLDPEDIKMGLESAWGVESKKDLLETLEWLSTEGHKIYFNLLWSKFTDLPREQWMLAVPELEKIAEANKDMEAERLQEYSQNLLTTFPLLQKANCLKEGSTPDVTAWDLERSINLCRFGFDVGFLTKEEAMAQIEKYAAIMFKTYKSWESMSEGFLLGCGMWSGMVDLIEDRLEMHQTLLSHEKSPWMKVKF